MSVMGVHGVSATTPENILLGAGTIHKNLTRDESSGKWTGECIGATSGGCSLEIKCEIKDIEVDGALVKVKGLAVQQGGTCTMEVNMAELTPDLLKMSTLGEIADSDVDGYTMVRTKATIEEGDYIPNFGFIGKTVNGTKDIVVVIENALCTSGLKIESKNKENTTIKLTMEAYANNEGNLDKLPVRIYYQELPTA